MMLSKRQIVFESGLIVCPNGMKPDLKSYLLGIGQRPSVVSAFTGQGPDCGLLGLNKDLFFWLL